VLREAKMDLGKYVIGALAAAVFLYADYKKQMLPNEAYCYLGAGKMSQVDGEIRPYAWDPDNQPTKWRVTTPHEHCSHKGSLVKGWGWEEQFAKIDGVVGEFTK
jgi:hypothetical protein